MLSQRVKAALIFTPLVLILVFLGGWLFNAFILIVLAIASYEYARLFQKIDAQPSFPLLAAGITAFLLQRWLLPIETLGIILTGTIFVTALVALVSYETGKTRAATGFTVNLAGILYLGWVGSYFIALRALPNGRGWLLTALPITWLADSGAYFIGRWLGKHKLTPKLSPRKTWEGYFGALATGTCSGVGLILLWRALGFLPQGTPLWQGAVMGLALSALTPIGDLLISLFKRSAGVKDTGNIIPGHGGFLDRIDTWIWAAVLAWYLVMVFA